MFLCRYLNKSYFNLVKSILLVLVLICSCTVSAKTKIVQVSTSIDRSKMLDFSVVAEFLPSGFSLAFDHKRQKFADYDINLSIKTNVKEGNTSFKAYELILSENNSSCFDKHRGDVTAKEVLAYTNTLTSIYLDGKPSPLVLKQANKISDFNLFDGTKNSTHKVRVAFSKITDESVAYCNGAFSILFRFDV